jgi:hypothetical protein
LDSNDDDISITGTARRLHARLHRGVARDRAGDVVHCYQRCGSRSRERHELYAAYCIGLLGRAMDDAVPSAGGDGGDELAAAEQALLA